MTAIEIFNNEIDALKLELIAKYNELGMKASGDWERSLNAIINITVTTFSAIIRGNHYTEYLTKGREPGGFPPHDVIRKWIDDKGITPKDNITKDQLAFLIARKIAREGTEYFKQGGTDLIDSVITPERIRKIVDALGVALTANLEFEVNEILLRK